MDRYINLFTDYGFKKVFGEEPNKDLLIAFLNELLDDKEQIRDLTYLNSERLGQTTRDRNAVFDLYCTNAQGEKFIVSVDHHSLLFACGESIDRLWRDAVNITRSTNRRQLASVKIHCFGRLPCPRSPQFAGLPRLRSVLPSISEGLIPISL